jgi:acyl carrier protein
LCAYLKEKEMKIEEFLNVVCSALDLEPNSLSMDDSPQTVEEWDSVGHLSIIACIEEELGVAIDEVEMQNFESVQQLVDRLIVRGKLET